LAVEDDRGAALIQAEMSQRHEFLAG